MGDIAYQNKDVTAKVMAEALKGKSLARRYSAYEFTGDRKQ